MPKGDYRGISLPAEVIKTIEEFIEENPEANYKSIADFVSDAIRVRFQQLGVYPGKISLLEINANEQGPLLYDKDLQRSIQVYISRAGIECGECKTSNCRHVKFILKNPRHSTSLRKSRNKDGNSTFNER